MWEIAKYLILGGALLFGASTVAFIKQRRPENVEETLFRLTATMSETLKVRAPGHPLAQIMLCQTILRERIEEGVDGNRYGKILTDALHANWPHIPKGYFVWAVR